MRQINRFDRLTLLAMSLALIAITPEAQAQSIIANDRTGTIVNAVGNQFTITKGTPSGQNLFHSFQKFDLPSGKATFEVPGGIQNILARVTGGNSSLIQGQLAVNGANLYFMNPAGVIFGKGATLDITGAFVTTTANGIGFGNGKWFSAVGENNYAELTGTPTQFAFTEKQAGSIVQAGEKFALKRGTGGSPTPQGQPLVMIGGTIFAPKTWETDGGVILTTVSGRQVVTLNLLGEPLSSSVQINPLNFGQSAPNRWTVPIQSLPTLLTGPGIQDATDLQVNTDGSLSLIVPPPNPALRLSIQPGDILLHSLKTPMTGNPSKRSGYYYDVIIDAQTTFRAFEVLDPNARLPVSLRSVGDITIRHGGTAFVQAIGYQRDAKGIVFKDPQNRRVLFNGLGMDTQVRYKYEDDGSPFDINTQSFSVTTDPQFNPTTLNAQQSYTKGTVVIQNNNGNGSLSGVLQESTLPTSRDIQVSQGSRIVGTDEPSPAITPTNPLTLVPSIELTTLSKTAACSPDGQSIASATRSTTAQAIASPSGCQLRSLATPPGTGITTPSDPILKLQSNLTDSLQTLPQLTPDRPR